MSIEVFHCFKCPTEGIKYWSFDEALNYNGPDKEYISKRIEQIKDSYRAKKTKKDAFEPGWQENIRENITCPGEYKRRLKELGLVEIGYDYVPQCSTKTGEYLKSDQFVNAITEIVPGMTGNEMEAIKEGKYFDSTKVDLGDS